MMRDYKFRAKSTDESIKDWLYGFGVYVVDYVDGSKSYHLFTEHGNYDVNPETVGQYTNLNDNVIDEEWYEGDILTPNPHSERTELEVICFDRHQGRYKSVPMSLYLSNAGNGGWTGYDVKCYQKRVGNIFDHKHLLNLPGEVDHE